MWKKKRQGALPTPTCYQRNASPFKEWKTKAMRCALASSHTAHKWAQGDHKWQLYFLPALVSRGGCVGGVCTVSAVGPLPTVSLELEEEVLGVAPP